MISESERTLARETYLLEGYKDLSRWNIQEDGSLINLDRFLITASVGACLLTLAKAREAYPAVYLGSGLVLYFWLLLSIRYKARIKHRFLLMHEIEKQLRFSAHIDYDSAKLTYELVFPRKSSNCKREECKSKELPTADCKPEQCKSKVLPTDIEIRRRFFFGYLVVMFPAVIKGIEALPNLMGNLPNLQIISG